MRHHPDLRLTKGVDENPFLPIGLCHLWGSFSSIGHIKDDDVGLHMSG